MSGTDETSVGTAEDAPDNKTDAIWKAAHDNPGKTSNQLLTILTERGIDVKSSYVSSTLFKLKKQGRMRMTHGKKFHAIVKQSNGQPARLNNGSEAESKTSIARKAIVKVLPSLPEIFGSPAMRQLIAKDNSALAEPDMQQAIRDAVSSLVDQGLIGRLPQFGIYKNLSKKGD
jgi:hypothetical protein